MLFELAVVILSILLPLMCYLSFVKGYNIGARETDKPKIELKPRKKMSKSVKKNLEEQQKYIDTLFSNIDAYDCTSVGQKEL